MDGTRSAPPIAGFALWLEPSLHLFCEILFWWPGRHIIPPSSQEGNTFRRDTMESTDKKPLGQVRAWPELAEGTPSTLTQRLLPEHPPPRGLCLTLGLQWRPGDSSLIRGTPCRHHCGTAAKLRVSGCEAARRSPGGRSCARCQSLQVTSGKLRAYPAVDATLSWLNTLIRSSPHLLSGQSPKGLVDS